MLAHKPDAPAKENDQPSLARQVCVPNFVAGEIGERGFVTHSQKVAMRYKATHTERLEPRTPIFRQSFFC